MPPTVSVRFLSREDIIACGALDMHAAMNDVENALRLQAAGEGIMPAEVALRWEADKPIYGSTQGSETGAYALPAYLGGSAPIVGVKWTAHRSPEAEGSDPRVMGLIVLTDPRSGRPFAVMESALIGAVRTAAATGLAIRHLDRANAHCVTVIGAGLHARTHLQMLAMLAPDAGHVAVVNRTHSHAQRMVAELRSRLPWEPEVRELSAVAVADSDIVICCTAAAQPFFEAHWVHPGLLVVSVGPFELTYDAMRAFDAVVVDGWGAFKDTSLKGLFRMYRDGKFGESDVNADLCGLILRGCTIPRSASVFVSLFGLSIFDIAVASRIARTAQDRGIGREFPLFGTSGQ